MMPKRWAAAAAMLLLLLLAGPGAGHAATEANFAAKTAGDIVALCDPQSQSAIDTAGVNFCQGFFEGAVLVEQEHEANPHSRKYFCLPDPAPSRNDAMRGFVAWAHAAPGRLDMSAVDGLIGFMGATYPCPKHK